MNVHHASLFPDLLGASAYCNILIAETALQRELEAPSRAPFVTAPPTPAAPSDETAPEEAVVEDEVGNLEELLRSSVAPGQVEPGRIRVIARELMQEIEKNKVVDWETRDAIQARLRNVARVILRKYNYPAGGREEVASRVLDLARGPEDPETVT